MKENERWIIVLDERGSWMNLPNEWKREANGNGIVHNLYGVALGNYAKLFILAFPSSQYFLTTQFFLYIARSLHLTSFTICKGFHIQYGFYFTNKCSWYCLAWTRGWLFILVCSVFFFFLENVVRCFPLLRYAKGCTQSWVMCT